MSEPVPTFIGIGAVKAGTTSIHHYLGEHPEVYVPEIKETNYFAHEGQRNLRHRVCDWPAYLARFAPGRGAKAIGEFSPIYLENPHCAKRIDEALPAVKIVASFRSPVDRAYSGWIGSVRSGIENEPAGSAIRPGSRYIRRGFYSRMLKPYLERFGRERIQFILFEDLAADPARTMASLYEFLGVDPGFVPHVEQRHNAASFPRYPRLNRAWQALRRRQPLWFRAPEAVIRWNRRLMESTFSAPPPIDPELREALARLYRDEVERMEEILERDLESWRR